VSSTTTLSASATGSHPLCNTGSTGSINLAVSGGTPAYTYAWTGGVTTQNLSGLAAGTYSVTVTDTKGCEATASATLTAPAAMIINPTVTNVACNGYATGAISLSITNGASPYTYAWSDGPAVNPRTGLVAGTYTVTVTDSKSCTQTLGGISVTEGTITATAAAGTILCNGASTTLTVTAGGGTAPLQYSLNGGTYQSSNTFTVYASAVEYIVTVKDANNCTKATNGVLVTQPTAITPTTVISHESCPGKNDASINLSVTGGTPGSGYTYDWSNDGYEDPDNDTEDLSGLTAGTYTVIVTDSKGCTATLANTVRTLNANPSKPGGIK
jgi:hypothetical protein